MSDWLTRQSKYTILALSLAVVLVVGVVDHLTGRNLSFVLFYAIPVLLVTWLTDRVMGLAVAATATFMGFAADIIGGAQSAIDPVVDWNVLVRFGTYVLLVAVLSRLKASWHNERELARIDGLTGVANSRWLFISAEQELHRMRRSGRPLSVAYMDIDDFKKINDTFGHAAGDEALVELAGLLTANLRPTDIVGRLGGDEFVLILPETDRASAEGVVARLRERLAVSPLSRRRGVTLSIGVVTFTTPMPSTELMLRQADAAMYSVKAAGKDSVAYQVQQAPQAQGSSLGVT
jgi:diguanylate cyclase (GGDEF)-like protein